MKVTVLYNKVGTSTTENISQSDEDTDESAQEVSEGLKKLGYNVDLLAISQEDINSLNDLQTDVVFNLIEWSGRDVEDAVKAIKILEDNNIKFTGCGSEAYRLSTDKTLMKKLFVKQGIPTPNFQIMDNTIQAFDGKLSFPLIIKPAMEHCAIGISQKSVVFDEENLMSSVKSLIKEFNQPIIVEEFIDGLEAHVTVLEKGGQPWVLPPAVFEYKKRDGYIGLMTYAAKWDNDSSEVRMTEWREVSHELEVKIQDLGKDTFLKTSGRSHSRIDLRIRGDELYVLEINHNPGLGWDKDTGIVYSCNKAGLSYELLLDMILKSA